jgi:hypothetical protein
MKKAILLAGILTLFLCVVPALGESWETKAKTNVPFEFMAGDTVLPAGVYTVQTAITSPSRLIITNKETGASAIVSSLDIILSSSRSMAPITKMVFAYDGSRHVLHQVVIKGDDHVHDLLHGAEIAELEAPPY